MIEIINEVVEVSIDNPVTEIEIESVVVEIEVNDGNITNIVNSLSNAYQIAVGVIEQDPTTFNELVYTGDDLTRIDIWDTPAKNNLLMQKVFTYNSGDLSQIDTTYSGSTLRKNFSYTNGNLVSINTTVVL